MRKIRYNVAMSLDGFIASPDGSTDWIVEDASIDFDKLYASFSTFVMGRKTYETMLGFGDQNPLRGRPRDALIVASRSVTAAERYGDAVRVVGGEGQGQRIEEVVERLRRAEVGGGGGEDARDIWVYGGGQLATCLLNAGLVDTVEVAIMPVLIGEGLKMVQAGDKSGWALRLEGTEVLGSGIVMCKYTVLGKGNDGQTKRDEGRDSMGIGNWG